MTHAPAMTGTTMTLPATTDTSVAAATVAELNRLHPFPVPPPTPRFDGHMAPRMSEFSPEFSAFLNHQLDLDRQQMADRIIGLLRMSDFVVQGFGLSQLDHGLQTAASAEAAGMDVDMVVAALCHDIGKVVSTPNHGAIAAEMIKLYVHSDAYWCVLVHQDFEGVHYLGKMGIDPMLRRRYADHPAYELAERFADEWDEQAFDPDGTPPPLEHFEPMVREVFGRTPRLLDHWQASREANAAAGPATAPAPTPA